MADFKIGQVCTLKEDYESETWSGEKVKLRKGSKCIIGSDRLAHYFNQNTIQPLSKETVVSGYDHEGLAEWIWNYVKRVIPCDMLEDYDVSEEEIQEQIAEALSEILE